MTQVRDRIDDRRLEELRAMVHDDAYMTGAIFRLASVLSEELMNGIGVVHGGRQRGKAKVR